MSGNTFWAALGLALIMECLLPFVAPAAWRERMAAILRMGDGQIRTAALLGVLAGLALLWLT